MLSDRERQALLRLAREAIAAELTGTSGPPMVPDESLSRHAGAFVTLREGSELRGCIGYPGADEPLAAVVIRCAVSASTADPRFHPLQPHELDAVRLEISVLGPLEPVADPSEIEVGRHGLVVHQGLRRGLLLPQVATEWQWDRETFLAQTCVKAGLRPDAWRTGAEIFKFEAEVFGEQA